MLTGEKSTILTMCLCGKLLTSSPERASQTFLNDAVNNKNLKLIDTFLNDAVN